MPENNDEQPDYLWTVDEVAQYLRVSKSWVYQHAAVGDLPCLKIAGVLRFDPDAIRAVARGESSARGRVVALKPR